MTPISDQFFDGMRNFLPYILFIVLPFLIVISPINPVEAAQQFSVYRMHQFDLQGLKLGSRSVAFNFEVSSLSGQSRGSLTRKCLLLHLYEVTIEVLRQAGQHHVGGLLILLPRQWDQASKEHMLALEQELLNQRQDEHHMAIYFTYADEITEELYKEAVFATTAGKGSAASMLMKTLLSTGHQLYIPSVGSVNTGPSIPNFEIVNLQGKLPGLGVEETLPTIVVVAHYDATGTAPGLSYGYDSNASGVIVLLQLARYFSLLYSQQNTQPKFNIIFLLSGGGKLNYLGTKRWLDEHLEISSGGSMHPPNNRDSDSRQYDNQQNVDDSEQDWDNNGNGVHKTGTATSRHMSGPGLLNNVALVVCLEGLAWGDGTVTAGQVNPLHMHVSKPPRSGSLGEKFLHHLQWASKQWGKAETTQSNVHMVHKKINLKEDFLAWEHERFSLNRLPGLTLSRYSTHQAPTRRSILDDGTVAGNRDNLLMGLHESTQVITEAILQLMFDLPTRNNASVENKYQSVHPAERTPFLESDTFSVDTISSLLSLMTRQSRSAVLLPRNHALLAAMERIMVGHLGAQNVRINRVQADPRDPEFLLYDHCSMAVMHAYKVKPVVFEMLMSLCILAYLSGFYLLALIYPQMCSFVTSALKVSKTETYERRMKTVN